MTSTSILHEYKNLEDCSSTYDDSAIISKVLGSLPEHFSEFRRVWNMLAGKTDAVPRSIASHLFLTKMRTGTDIRCGMVFVASFSTKAMSVTDSGAQSSKEACSSENSKGPTHEHRKPHERILKEPTFEPDQLQCWYASTLFEQVSRFGV